MVTRIVTKYCSIVLKVLSLVLFGSKVQYYSLTVLKYFVTMVMRSERVQLSFEAPPRPSSLYHSSNPSYHRQAEVNEPRYPEAGADPHIVGLQVAVYHTRNKGLPR